MNKLTNTDIINRLLEMPNVCDRTLALKKFSKEYKKSPFYRATHKNLNLLYYEVSIENLLTLSSLLQSAQEFINHLDLTNFESMMDQINNNTLATINAGVSSMSETGLTDLLKIFKKA